MQAHIHTFINNTVNNFNHTLTFVNQFLFSNTLLPATETFSTFIIRNLDGSWLPSVGEKSIYHLNRIVCYCSMDLTCHVEAGFFDDELFDRDHGDNKYAHLYVVDGWYIGCLTIQSLLFATLKSFYNQTVLDSFSLFFRNSSGNFTCLNANQSITLHSSDTTLKTIIEAIFIEKWIDNITYPSYFNICAPKSCSYKINKRFDILYIINILLGLYGGLSIALRIVVPMKIKLVIRYKHKAPKPEHTSSWLRKIRRTLIELNFFKSAIHVELRDIYRQRWSTRFYILFLILSLSLYPRTVFDSERTDYTNELV